MLKRIAHALWGKFESKAELIKFVLLALTFGLIIGTYWTLRPIKDSIFMSIVGKEFLYWAKVVSLAVTVPLVIIYSKLIETFKRHKVFYGLLTIYALLALGFAWAFTSPTLGLANAVTSPDRYIGWAWYVFVESFGSLIVALFWIIATDVTLPESAKRGFPMVALFGQLGNIFGPLFFNAQFLGFSNSAPIVAICGGLMVVTMIIMHIFRATTPKKLMVSFKGAEKEDKEEPGFFEGLKIIFTKKYMAAIFVIVAAYEFIVTILDYHFKQLVGSHAATELGRAALLKNYAVYTGILATVCVLLGINNITRRLGMKASLILTPILVAIALVLVKLNPTGLYIAMFIMVFSKAVNYALNQPTLKQLYIPTKQDTKYKAQGWIDMFGSRGFKGAASLGMNRLYSVLGINPFLTLTVVISSGIIGIWFLFILYAAKTYNKAVEQDKVVC